MQVSYCPNCEKHTGHKRSIGAGTVLGAIVTGGASLVAVPAYGKRCVICGLTVEEATKVVAPTAPPTAQDRLIGYSVLLGALLLAFVILVCLNR